MNVKEKLSKLRRAMLDHGIDLYLIPRSDPHHTESVAEYFDRGGWLSSFAASNCFIVISMERAWVWTDSRYFLHAEQHLDPIFTLGKIIRRGSKDLDEFLKSNCRGKVVGVDPESLPTKRLLDLTELLNSVQAEVKPGPVNLVDSIWQERPTLENHEVVLWPEQYAGLSASEKTAAVATVLEESFSDEKDYVYLEAGLDAVAWVCNLRGRDVPDSPLAYGFWLYSKTGPTRVFLNKEKISPELETYLKAQNIQVDEYHKFYDVLVTLTAPVLFDFGRTNGQVYSVLKKADIETRSVESPIVYLKSKKNSVEIQGMCSAHKIDAVAMVRFLYWLDTSTNLSDYNEYQVGRQLTAFRAQAESFSSPSFSSIVGYGPNGAIVHYRADSEKSLAVSDDNLLLIDSGGQYTSGTTDITRTVHLGEPEPEHKKHYTLVLKAHLAVKEAVFVKGVSGANLDALGRAHLWKHGLDYGHGTGHGVGCFLCVHESPPTIDYRAKHCALEKGMIVSIEPGLYFQGRYGIRIENLVYVDNCDKNDESERFLEFRDLTLVPYSRKLIAPDLLEPNEVAVIDAYHKRVVEELAPHLEPSLVAWLENLCAPLLKVG